MRVPSHVPVSRLEDTPDARLLRRRPVAVSLDNPTTRNGFLPHREAHCTRMHPNARMYPTHPINGPAVRRMPFFCGGWWWVCLSIVLFFFFSLYRFIYLLAVCVRERPKAKTLFKNTSPNNISDVSVTRNVSVRDDWRRSNFGRTLGVLL